MVVREAQVLVDFGRRNGKALLAPIEVKDGTDVRACHRVAVDNQVDCSTKHLEHFIRAMVLFWINVCPAVVQDLHSRQHSTRVVVVGGEKINATSCACDRIVGENDVLNRAPWAVACSRSIKFSDMYDPSVSSHNYSAS